MPQSRAGALHEFADAGRLGRLRDALVSSGYVESGDMSQFVAGPAETVPLPLARMADDRRLATLVRLLRLGIAIDAVAARAALEPADLSDLCEAGLLRAAEGRVRAAVRLVPYRGLVLACDVQPGPGETRRPDFVLGVGAATDTLARFAIGRHIGEALDLGTGCGSLALLAARHSDAVVGTDLNRRAIELARFNARLNQVANVELLEGSWFEPVADRRFDLIVCNPPFVISPESSYIYRDGGLPGDEVCRRIIREAPDYLDEGGYLQMLFNWAHRPGERWQDRLAQWVAGTGCDAWVVCTKTDDPAAYAMFWLRESETGRRADVLDRFDEWMGYFRAQHIDAISTGLMAMRRRSGANWFRAEELAGRASGPLGDTVLQQFWLCDFLQSTSDEALLEHRFERCPDLRVERSYGVSREGLRILESRIRLCRGLPRSGAVDADVIRLLLQLDGRRSLREIIGELAGTSAQAPERIGPAVLRAVRELVERGFVLPEPAASGGEQRSVSPRS